MRRTGRLAGVLTLGLFAIGLGSYGQGPPRPGGHPGPPSPPPPGPNPGPLPSRPIAGLSTADLARWQVGQTAFLQPADVPGGLGPVFNENACARCHEGPGGSGDRLVTRFGRFVDHVFDPMVEFGGPTLQNRGIGRFNRVNFVGEVVPREATVVAQRRTSPLYGLGLVEAIPDLAIQALSDHQHQSTPSTAGRPSPVVDLASGQHRIGRFGWKSQQATLFTFSGDAYLNEMGITTPLDPSENCPQGNCILLAANPATNQPNETTNTSVQQVTDFIALSAPPPPGPTSPTTRAGMAIFGTIGCANCHLPTLQAGPSPVPAINGATFAPYSDFLLHDMGRLGDGIVQNQAGPTEMRTAPLWGLRFERSYLHDGRAPTVEAAILAHDGQGLAAAHAYSTMPRDQKAQLLAFLSSL